MIETSAVSGRRALPTASGSTVPSPSTGNQVTLHPCFSRSRHGLRIEMCSTAEATTWRPEARDVTPRIARLLASVALAVKITPAAGPPTRRATLARAPSRDARASSPSECRAAGLPTPPSRKGRMKATTRGSTGENPA